MRTRFEVRSRATPNGQLWFAYDTKTKRESGWSFSKTDADQEVQRIQEDYRNMEG